MRERLRVRGVFRLTVRNPKGEIVRQMVVPNGIVDVGFDFIADVIANPAQPSPMSYIGIGWGGSAGVAFDPTQTDLQGDNQDRNSATYAHTVGEKTFTLTATWGTDDPDSSPVTIEESGVFNASSGGVMLNRKAFTGFVKEPDNTLDIEWKFTMS